MSVPISTAGFWSYGASNASDYVTNPFSENVSGDGYNLSNLSQLYTSTLFADAIGGNAGGSTGVIGIANDVQFATGNISSGATAMYLHAPSSSVNISGATAVNLTAPAVNCSAPLSVGSTVSPGGGAITANGDIIINEGAAGHWRFTSAGGVAFIQTAPDNGGNSDGNNYNLSVAAMSSATQDFSFKRSNGANGPTGVYMDMHNNPLINMNTATFYPGGTGMYVQMGGATSSGPQTLSVSQVTAGGTVTVTGHVYDDTIYPPPSALAQSSTVLAGNPTAWNSTTTPVLTSSTFTPNSGTSIFGYTGYALIRGAASTDTVTVLVGIYDNNTSAYVHIRELYFPETTLSHYFSLTGMVGVTAGHSYVVRFYYSGADPQATGLIYPVKMFAL